MRWLPGVSLVALGVAACGSGAPPPLATPFETVDVPRELCGTPLEAELRRRSRFPACSDAVTLVFVRARAGEHDVVVVAFDDQTPTHQDLPPEHGACLFVDGARRGGSCGAPTEDPPTDPELHAVLEDAPPASDADARALVHAAILHRARTTHVALDVAGRDRISEGWGPVRELIRQVPVGPREGPDGRPAARAISAIRDHFFGGWAAAIDRYDAWLDRAGAVHVRVEELFHADAPSRERRPPWEAPGEDR